MTTTDTAAADALVGSNLYWLHTGFAYALPTNQRYTTIFTQRADQVIVTPALVEALTSSKGCILLLTPDEQIERFGYQLFGIGEMPSSVEWWSRDNAATFELALAAARKAAFAIPVEEDRYKALAEVKRKFGTPATSSVLMTIRGEENR
jgi:hypothetical protein